MANTINTDKVQKVLEKASFACLSLMVVLEFAYVSIVAKIIGNKLETVLLAIAIVLGIVFIASRFTKAWPQSVELAKRNFWILIYFFIRIVSWAVHGFDYSILRQLLIEVTFLIFILFAPLSEKYLDRIIKLGLCLILIGGVLETAGSTVITLFPDSTLGEFIKSHSWFNPYMDKPSVFYSNSNHFGMLSGLGIVLSYMQLNKTSQATKRLYYINIALCILMLIVSECRSAEIAILLVFVSMGIQKIFKIKETTLTIGAASAIMLAFVCLFGFFILSPTKDTMRTPFEESLNYLSSGRYTVWRDMYYSHTDDYILGTGSITLEKQERYKYRVRRHDGEGLDENSSLREFRGPHNGYLGMLYCAGIPALLVFGIIILKKSKKLIQQQKKAFALSIYILVINCFETMIITSFNMIFIIYTLYLNVYGNEDEKKN